MRPDFLSLLLLSSFLGLTASVCVPRNADPSKYLYSPPPTNSPKSSPPPKASSPGAPAPAKSSPPPPSPSPSGGASAALKPICAFTDYPDLCMSSIQSVAPSLGSSVTVQDAVGLQIKVHAAKAQAAIGYAKKLIGDPEVSKDAGSCRKDCLDQYDDGIDNLEAAKSALAARDSGTVSTMLSAAFDSFSCSDTFSEGEDLGNCKGSSPMKDHLVMLFLLAYNL